jgi:hypothetical protein
MTAPFENIVQHLFHQPSLQSVTIDELERMTQQYPSFAAARFLLLKKMQDTNHPEFSSQLHVTTLYFNNPLWLQFLLQPQNGVVMPSAVTKETIVGHTGPAEASFPLATVEASAMGDSITASATIEEEEEEEETLHEESVPVEIPVPIKEIQTAAIDIKEAPQEAAPVRQQAEEPMAMPEEHTVQSVMLDEEMPADDTYDGTPTAAPAEEKPASTTTEPAPASLLSNLSGKIIIETQQAKDDLLFEPYHTIDYFASQGIRLDKIEPNPQDKLGRQLKSFTEWLKGMKRLPQASVEKVLATNEESAVITAAAHSVEDKEVITEAMAEVFAKQGLHEKAAGVYRKLSLLNPAKSAYFAARIEALK